MLQPKAHDGKLYEFVWNGDYAWTSALVKGRKYIGVVTYQDGLYMIMTFGVPPISTGSTRYSDIQILREVDNKERENYLTEVKANAQKNGFRVIDSGITGTDPEIFVVGEGGALIPAWKFLGPKPKEIPKDGRARFWDGAQAEFNVPAMGCHSGLSMEIRDGLFHILQAAKVFDPKAKLTWEPVMKVSKKDLAEADDEHVAFGCAPSLSAYGEPAVDIPNPRALPFRFAGCHIHFAEPGINPELAVTKVKALDAILGPVMTAAFRGMDNPLRREFYGRAGEYRLPKHGLEYRTPSSVVLAHPTTYHLVFNFARYVYRHVMWGYNSYWKVDQERVRDVVNSSNHNEALKILQENKDIFEAFIQGCWYTENQRVAVRRLVFDGAKNVLDIENMNSSWALDKQSDPLLIPNLAHLGKAIELGTIGAKKAA